MVYNSRVKVYNFRKYDIVSDCFISSHRMATRACIERIRALPIKGTELEINKHDLDDDGMTEIGYREKRLGRGIHLKRGSANLVATDGCDDPTPFLARAAEGAETNFEPDQNHLQPSHNRDPDAGRDQG